MPRVVEARIERVWARAAQALRPPPLEPLSAFIEGNVRLPLGLAAESGPLHLWPTQRGIADALADPELDRVTLAHARASRHWSIARKGTV
jgi:hypothetical protein